MQAEIIKKMTPPADEVKKALEFAGYDESLMSKCQTMAGNLNQEQLEQIAERFRLLGEPMRLRILAFLREGELNVNDLVEATGSGQANISRHLSALRQSGVLARRKEGTRVFYRIADETVYELCRVVCRGDKQLEEVF